MVKRLNFINFRLQSQCQRFFIPNFVCVLRNKRYNIYQTRFSFGRLGHALGMGLDGGQFFFSKYGQVAYQIEGGDE